MFKKLFSGLLVFCSFTSLFAQAESPNSSPTEPPPSIVFPRHMERTLVIVKPDAVMANHIGDILQRFERSGLKVIAIKMTHLTQVEAQQFYAVHKAKPFFGDLVLYMSSGPSVPIVLEGEDAIAKAREIIGATNPKIAAPGTIRADFAKNMTENAIHGSDSPESARNEISFFFRPQEIFKK